MINTVDYIFVEVAVCTFSCTIRPVDVHSDLAQKLGNEFWTFNGFISANHEHVSKLMNNKTTLF